MYDRHARRPFAPRLSSHDRLVHIRLLSIRLSSAMPQSRNCKPNNLLSEKRLSRKRLSSPRPSRLRLFSSTLCMACSCVHTPSSRRRFPPQGRHLIVLRPPVCAGAPVMTPSFLCDHAGAVLTLHLRFFMMANFHASFRRDTHAKKLTMPGMRHYKFFDGAQTPFV